MSRITPFLYLGDAKNAADINFLKSKKVILIVNCAKELPNYFPNQFQYVRLNWDDYPEQDISNIEYATEDIIKYIKSKHVVFVHCAAGVSRSAIVVIATIMKLHNWDFNKSKNYVKQLRNVINPNSGFVAQLQDFSNKTIGDGASRNTHPEGRTSSKMIPTVQRNNSFEILDNGNNENREHYSPVNNEMRGDNFPMLNKSGSPIVGDDQKEMVAEGEHSKWSSLTFDSPKDDQPEFVKNKKRMYAKIL